MAHRGVHKMSDAVASSGTLIAAALETVGYHYQSHILDALTGGRTAADGYGGTAFVAIAAFVYIIAAIAAMIQFAMTSRYKLGLWFLLGPGCFYFVTLYRIESSGTNWLFGDEARSERLKEAVVTNVLGYTASEKELPVPRVSWFFHEFNRMLSEAGQSLIKHLMNGRKDMDLRFMVRAPLYGAMVTSMIDDKNFKELVHVAILRNCREVYEAAMNVNDKTLTPREREASKLVLLGQKRYEMDKIWRNPDTPESDRRIARAALDIEEIKLTDGAATYLAGLKVDYPHLFHAIGAKLWRKDPKAEPNSPMLQGKEIEYYLKQKEELIGPGKKYESEVDPRRQREIQKYARSFQDCRNGFNCTCEQVWNLTYFALHVEARKALRVSQEYARELGLDPANLELDWLRAAGYKVDGHTYQNMDPDERMMAMYRVIAKHLFRNEIVVGAPAAMIADFAKRGQEQRSLAIKGENELSMTERLRTANKAWQEKTRLVNAAASIPYYQGILLYLLSLSYPFFCFLLLIPGKHRGFLLFFTLWFWVKMWDVGFAVVMFLDDIFYTIFTGSMAAHYKDAGTSPELDDNIGLALAALNAADPTFQMAQYHNIIAVAINAVPVVMSYLTIGSLRGGAGLIAEGTAKYGDVFARVAWKTSSNYAVMGYRVSTMDRRYDDVLATQAADDGTTRAGYGHMTKPLAQFGHDDGSQPIGRRVGGYLPVVDSNASLAELRDFSIDSGQVTGALEGASGNLAAQAIRNVVGDTSAYRPGKNRGGALHRGATMAEIGINLSDRIGHVSGTMSDVARDAHWAQLVRLASTAMYDSMTSAESLLDMRFARIQGDVFELPFMDLEIDINRVEFDIMLEDNLRWARVGGSMVDAVFGVIDDFWAMGNRRSFNDSFRRARLHERNIEHQAKTEWRKRVKSPDDIEGDEQLKAEDATRYGEARAHREADIRRSWGKSPERQSKRDSEGFMRDLDQGKADIPDMKDYIDRGDLPRSMGSIAAAPAMKYLMRDSQVGGAAGQAEGGEGQAGPGDPNAERGTPVYRSGDPRYPEQGERPFKQAVVDRNDFQGWAMTKKDEQVRDSDILPSTYGDPSPDAAVAQIHESAEQLRQTMEYASTHGLGDEHPVMIRARGILDGPHGMQQSYLQAMEEVLAALRAHKT